MNEVTENSNESARADIDPVLRTLLPDWSTEAVKVIAHLPGGYSHPNYRISHLGADYVLRIPTSPANEGDLRFEHQWLQSLPVGFGADVIAHDPQTGALLTRWISAPLLVEKNASTLELVDYLVALHGRMPALERRYDLLGLIDTWLRASPQPDVIKHARRTLQGSTENLRPCHNDLNPWNILCDPAGWRTLDWEWVGLNDPVFDLVTLAVGVGVDLTVVPEMARRYLALMGEQISDADGRVHAATQGFWLREYAWADHATHHGNHRVEVLAQRTAALQKIEELSGHQD